MTILPIGNVGVGRDRPLVRPELHHLDLGLLQEPRQQGLAGLPQPRAQHQGALDHGRGAGTELLGRYQLVSETLVTRFLQQDSHDGRAVDDHTLSGP
jgi:hypothetical protein